MPLILALLLSLVQAPQEALHDQIKAHIAFTDLRRPTDKPSKAAELANACKEHAGKAEDVEKVRTAACHIALRSMLDLAFRTQSAEKFICFPSNRTVTETEIASIFVDWVARHPEWQSEDSYIQLWTALAWSYPCQSAH